MEEEEICFICNEEECEGKAADSVLIKCDKFNFWAYAYCILHIVEFVYSSTATLWSEWFLIGHRIWLQSIGFNSKFDQVPIKSIR